MSFIRVFTILCLALIGWTMMPSAAVADETSVAEPQSQPAMPRMKVLGSIYYPDKAKLTSSQGRFLLEFAIDGRGHVAQINMESAEGDKILSDSAVALLKGLVFERPSVPGPAMSQRYRMSIVFELKPCGRLHHFDVPKDAQISVCGSPIGRP